MGKTFALIYAPGVREDTFLHLNREGLRWKVRWYSSPHKPPTALAQSGLATTRQVLDLSSVKICQEISYPYSSAPDGVTVENSQYWFDQVLQTNTKHAERFPALRQG